MLSFFKKVPAWNMDKAKTFIAENNLDKYQLLDVRQPNEFEQGHLPGAKLIPLGELPNRIDEVKTDIPVLVYCRSGGRAGNAVATLHHAGIDQAVNVGGIMQWQGIVASGPPQAGMSYFDAARKPEDYVALAWQLEEQAQLFYLDLADHFEDISGLLRGLAAGEDHHKDLLQGLYNEISGTDDELPLPDGVASDMMEGGIGREAATAWAKEHSSADALDFAVAMEANAVDRYMRLGTELGGEAQRAFIELAKEEKGHVDALMQAYQARL